MFSKTLNLRVHCARPCIVILTLWCMRLIYTFEQSSVKTSGYNRTLSNAPVFAGKMLVHEALMHNANVAVVDVIEKNMDKAKSAAEREAGGKKYTAALETLSLETHELPTPPPPTPTMSRPVLMCFCFDNELDLLYIKFEMFHRVVTKFIIAESTFSGRGLPKVASFTKHMHEPRWVDYLPQIVHIVDDVQPEKTGKNLGMAQTSRVKEVIGDYLIRNLTFSSLFADGIVLLSDMDELPSLEQVIWMANHCCKPRETIVVDMPYYMYGVHWIRWGVSTTTLSARNLKDEIGFWSARKTGAKFQQVVRRIPHDIKGLAHGIHCSYCSTNTQNVHKLQHTNVVDGPPFLGEFYWDENIFAMLKACGIAPNGDALRENHNSVHHVVFAEFDHYSYMKQDTVPVCHPAVVPESHWEEIFPLLKQIPKLKWIIVKSHNNSSAAKP